MSAGQGQGKSTLIREVCNFTSSYHENPPIAKLDLQTSRETLKDWGYTLDEVNRYLPLKQKFQDELFKRHCQALQGAIDESNAIGTSFLVERTFSDIYAYTALGVGAFNEYSNWLANYKLKCEAAQLQFFDRIVFLTGRDYVPEDDGVRSTNTDFSDIANVLIEKYTNEFSDAEHITTPDLNERVEALHKIIRESI